MGSKRKIIVYIIFICSVVYGVWFHFLSDNRWTGPVPTPENEIAADKNNKEVDLPCPEDKTGIATAVTAPPQPAILPHGWGPNPFRSHDPTARKAAGKSDQTAVNRLHLTGISYHEDRASFAIINNKVVQATETIGGWQVVSIYRDYVMIKKSKTIEKLMMGDIL